MTCLVLIGWVISYADEWEDYSSYFGEGVEISRNWTTTDSLVFWQCFKTVMLSLSSVTQLCPTLCCQECVISLVLSHNKDLKWQTSVTALLELRVLFSKQRIVHPWGMKAGWPQKRDLSLSWLPLFIHFVSSPWACPMQSGLARKRVCLFHLRFSLWSMDFLLFHFCGIFLFFVF